MFNSVLNVFVRRISAILATLRESSFNSGIIFTGQILFCINQRASESIEFVILLCSKLSKKSIILSLKVVKLSIKFVSGKIFFANSINASTLKATIIMVFHNISLNVGNRVFLFTLFATINSNVGIRSNNSSIRRHFLFIFFCVFFRTHIASILFVFLSGFVFFLVLVFRLFIRIVIVFLSAIFAALSRLDLLFAIVFGDFFMFVC